MIVSISKLFFHKDDESTDGTGQACLDDDNGDHFGHLEQMTEMNPTPERVAVHLKCVSKKLRQRLFHRAMRNYKGAQERTQEAFGKLHGVVDLVRTT